MKALYIHGFNSAGFGGKVNDLRTAWGPCIVNPSLPLDPEAALDLLSYLTSGLKTDKFCVVGSSLGGLYALRLAVKFQVKAVLINPGFLNLKKGLNYALGELTNYKTAETALFTPADLSFLGALELSEPEYKAIASHTYAYFDADDEVLPSQENAAFLNDFGIDTQVYSGGNHQFQHMAEMLLDLKQKWS